MPVRHFPRSVRLLLAVALAAPVAVGSLPASAEEATAAAPAGDVAAVVEGVEAAYKDLQSLKAEFSQVTRSVAMGEGEVQQGSLAMERPRKMRWDFKVPDDKLFVTDGKTMWVYNPGDNQVIISEDLGGGGDGDGDGMTELLDNLDSLGQYFDVTELEGPEGTHTLALKPKKESVQFKKLRLTLEAGDYTLQKLVVVDAFDSETELSFTNVEKNVDVPDADFVFTVPDGAEVVRADGI